MCTDFPVEVLLTAIPLYSRKVLHVVWRDITERKRAEEELEKEAQYRGIFESTSDSLLIFDLDGTIVLEDEKEWPDRLRGIRI